MTGQMSRAPARSARPRRRHPSPPAQPVTLVAVRSACGFHSFIEWCREAPGAAVDFSSTWNEKAPSSASCPRARRQNHARDADRTCRTFRCIERDALQRASNAPGVGSERHVVLSSASDEADAKKFIGESSRFVSQIRRCEPEDRGGVGIDERGPSAPRIPRPRPAQQSSADDLSLATLSRLGRRWLMCDVTEGALQRGLFMQACPVHK